MIPLIVSFSNHNGGAAASEVTLSFPNLSKIDYRLVEWGDGTSSKVYGGMGNRVVHNYGNPRHEPYEVQVYGDVDVVDFYDPNGDRAAAKIVTWGDYNVGKVIFPDLSVKNHP